MKLKPKLKKKTVSVSSPQTTQEIQEEIFRKMPFAKKIKLTSDLTMFCLKLNRLNRFDKLTVNGNNKPGKTSLKSRSNFRRA